MTDDKDQTMRVLAAPVAPLIGLAARQALILYLAATFLVMFILLVTALSIDLSRHYAEIRDRAASTDIGLLRILLPYLTFRAADIVVRLLPMACFFGLFFSEIYRRQKLDSVILSVSGYSPLQALNGIVIFAVIVGVLEFSLENTLTRKAVQAQIQTGLGTYGHRFPQGLTDRPNWFVSGPDALRARVLVSEAPELRDIELFRGVKDKRLSEVIFAESAQPTERPMIWLFHDVVHWQIGTDGFSYVPSKKAELEVRIALIPEQLTYYNVHSYFIPIKALKAITLMRDGPSYHDARTALWRRWTALIFPGAFGFLGASLAQVGYTRRQSRTPLLLVMVLFGYVLIVSVKVFWSLGESGALSPFWAVTPSIVIALLTSLYLQFRQL